MSNNTTGNPSGTSKEVKVVQNIDPKKVDADIAKWAEGDKTVAAECMVFSTDGRGLNNRDGVGTGASGSAGNSGTVSGSIIVDESEKGSNQLNASDPGAYIKANDLAKKKDKTNKDKKDEERSDSDEPSK